MRNPTNHKNLTKRTTCFKNPNEPSCTDVILTNRQKEFTPFALIETGISDFHETV